MNLTISADNWTEQAANILAPSVPNANILDIKNQIDENQAQLFKVENAAGLVGFYVLRIDELINHNEGVIIAAAGSDKNFDLCLAIIPAIEKQFINCKYLRIHTARPGLVKKLTQSGFKPLEFVMIKGLNNGQ